MNAYSFQGSPLVDAYRAYSTQYPDTEIIGSMLYDTIAFVSGAGGTTVGTFFTAGRRATLDLTNMEAAGSLPAPKAMLVRAFRFYVKQVPRVIARSATGNVQAGAVDNIAQLINTGVATLNIGNKSYAQFPLWAIPSGAGAFGVQGLDGNTADPGLIVDHALSGVPSAENALVLSQPLFIGPSINFSVVINWPAVITLAGGNTNICFVMDGNLVRPVQ